MSTATLEVRGVRTGCTEARPQQVSAQVPVTARVPGVPSVLHRAVAGAGVLLASAAVVVGLGLLADVSAAGHAPAVPAVVSTGR